jgi:hypothetical protein
MAAIIVALGPWPGKAMSETTEVGKVVPTCPGNLFTYKDGACTIEPAELQKRTKASDCKPPELVFKASAADPTTGTCEMDPKYETPKPICTPTAWNIVYKDKKCLLTTDVETAKAKEFFANWAVGIAVIQPRVRTVTDAAIVPAGAASGATARVRVNSEVRQESAMLVARHFYPWNPGRRCAQGGRFSTNKSDDSITAPITGFFASCVGAMVAVGLPTSGAVNGQVINFAGVGLAVGSGPATEDNSLAWNLGFGWGRKFNARVLGDGWVENAEPPEGETQIRYKSIDVGARFFYFTVHW